MTPRERLQWAYELAFFPPRLNDVWSRLQTGEWPLERPDLVAALDDAARLHLALPEDGYSSQRALERLARYQACSRAYGMPRFLRSVRAHLGLPPLPDTVMPGALVRDIAIPELRRTGGRPTDVRG